MLTKYQVSWDVFPGVRQFTVFLACFAYCSTHWRYVYLDLDSFARKLSLIAESFAKSTPILMAIADELTMFNSNSSIDHCVFLTLSAALTPHLQNGATYHYLWHGIWYVAEIKLALYRDLFFDALAIVRSAILLQLVLLPSVDCWTDCLYDYVLENVFGAQIQCHQREEREVNSLRFSRPSIPVVSQM